MFVGHYAAAVAAKAADPRAPLWTYVAGAQLLDIAWGIMVVTGVEKVRFDATLPGSQLDLISMPWSHSLPAALLWAALALAACRYLVRLPWGASAMVGAVVLSHWFLDLLVHRPDLPLWPDGPEVGLKLWNLPLTEIALEMGLLALAAVAWTACLKSAGSRAVTAFAFTGMLALLQMLAGLPIKSDPGPLAIGVTAVVLYLAVTGVSLFFDRPRLRSSPFRR
ncbi:MAG TPA: hypothetical protein VF559_04135 [Caulobacteraceae bacterium]|jgi:hypothetical protein